MPRRIPDTSKIEKLVGFRPTVSLDAILERVIEHLSTS
jgi:nucleoside-diphosphate-sugar epimerase